MNLKELQKEFLEKGGEIKKLPIGKIANEKSLYIMDIKELTNDIPLFELNKIEQELNL